MIGGPTGCIVASRLAEADPQLSILVIEGGQDNYNHPQVIHPGLLLANLKPDSLTCVHHKSSQQEQLMRREIIATVGSVLGGSSSINGLVYVRGQQSDYDAWNMPGWSSTDILPYLKKVSSSKQFLLDIDYLKVVLRFLMSGPFSSKHTMAYAIVSSTAMMALLRCPQNYIAERG